MNKDKWIEEIIGTAAKMDTAKAHPSLYAAIERRLNEKQAVPVIHIKYIYAAAVAIAVLLVLNISVWTNITKSKDNSKEAIYRSEFSLTGNNAYSLNY